MMKVPKVSLWQGTPVSELTRSELVDALDWCAGEIERTRVDRDRWRKAGDAAKYLLDRDSRQIGEIFGIKFIENQGLPEGEVWVCQDNKIIGRIAGLAPDKNYGNCRENQFGSEL